MVVSINPEIAHGLLSRIHESKLPEPLQFRRDPADAGPAGRL